MYAQWALLWGGIHKKCQFNEFIQSQCGASSLGHLLQGEFSNTGEYVNTYSFGANMARHRTGLVLGALIGLTGGPSGMLFGAAIGYYLDKLIRSVAGVESWTQAKAQTAFFDATFCVMGKIAKADGQVTAEEIQYKLKSYLHHREFDENPLSVNQIGEIIKNKKAIYNLNVDKSENKFESGNKLEKFEFNKLPTYIQKNKDNFKDWIDE